METIRTLMNRTARVACVLALGAAGCVPIPHTVTYTSPVVTGRLSRADGTPMRHARVAVSTARGDSDCTTHAAETMANLDGTFYLAETASQVREKWVCLSDCAAPSYRFCVYEADSLRTVYRRYSPKRDRPDSITCVKDGEANAGRIMCATRTRRWFQAEVTR